MVGGPGKWAWVCRDGRTWLEELVTLFLTARHRLGCHQRRSASGSLHLPPAENLLQGAALLPQPAGALSAGALLLLLWGSGVHRPSLSPASGHVLSCSPGAAWEGGDVAWRFPLLTA